MDNTYFIVILDKDMRYYCTIKATSRDAIEQSIKATAKVLKDEFTIAGIYKGQELNWKLVKKLEIVEPTI